MRKESGAGLLSGDSNTGNPRKHDHKVQVDGNKYYEVNVRGNHTFRLKSGALGHVVVETSPGSNEIVLHSRLLQINDKYCYSLKEAEVKRALAGDGALTTIESLKLLFERPEKFEVQYTQQPFDFHFVYNEYGYQVTRIEEGGPARGIVPIGALVTMVNGQSLIYNSTSSLDQMMRDCIFPARITFEVFGHVVNEKGQVIISDSREGIHTKRDKPAKTGPQAMAVMSVPEEDSPLRENARKKEYPIIGILEWGAGFCTLIAGLLLLSALGVDKLMHVDTEWDDAHEAVEHMSLVIKSSQIVGESATTDDYVYEFEDNSLCSMPNNWFARCMEAHEYGKLFKSVCNEAKIWVGMNATACTLALVSAILIFVGKITYRDTALLGFGWCVLAMGIGFILTVIGSIIQMVNAVMHIHNGEEAICLCMMHDLHYQHDPDYQKKGLVTSTFDSCDMSLSASSILGSVAVAFWMPSLCLLCSSWMNTPKTLLYVGDH